MVSRVTDQELLKIKHKQMYKHVITLKYITLKMVPKIHHIGLVLYHKLLSMCYHALD